MTLSVNSAYNVTDTRTICPSALPYVWNGVTFNEAGTQSVTLTAVNGCDSVVSMTLAVNSAYNVSDTRTVCPSVLPYVWNGVTFNEAGTQSVTLAAANGCDSVVAMTLTVNPSYNVTDEQAICASELPYVWNGVTFNEAGTQSITLTAGNGCDSVVAMTLSVSSAYNVTDTRTICPSALPYVWNGITFNEAGTQSVTLTAANGCDSVVTMELTINPSTVDTLYATVLESSLPYILNDSAYSSAGTYTQTLTNAQGCDSILTLVLTSISYNNLPDNIDSADCVFFPEGTEWGIEVGWSSANIVSNLNIPLVGDLDGDSHPEIICFSRNGDSPNAPNTNNQILVFDGVTKQLKTTITMASPVTAYDAAAYGMVKLPSGKGLIVAACHDLKLRAYDITASNSGTPFWTSDVDFGSNYGDWGVNVNFADFNNDGHPEVYVRNKIYNAETGVLLGIASGGNNTGSSFAHYSHYTNWKLSSPLAANICNDSRSELILGNEIYDVNITNLNGTNGNTISLERQITPPNSIVPDGHAQVADFNLDGHLDLFISSRSIAGYWGEVSFYVWDVHNNVLSSPMTISTIMSGKSIPLIADIDNDGLLEVLIQCDVNGSNEKIRAYKYDYATSAFSFMWGLAPDEDSYSNAITAFDFNQDGLLELMICDQSTVRIVNGSGHSHITGNDTIPMYVMSSFPFSEITIMQYPIIVDVDADGNAEIVSVGSDKLNIFESTGLPWAPARKVWNQYMYNVTNVNEDLTVPRYLFNNATAFTDPQGVVRKPFNNFLQQATSIDQYGRPFYAVPDVAVTSTTVQTDLDSITLSITYCNQGDNTLNTPYPITVFANAYGGDTICTVTIAQSLPADSCTQSSIRMPFSMLCSQSALDSLVIAVNCAGGHLAQNGGLQPECDTTNNIIGVPFMMHSDSVSITDVSCNSYVWNDSTYTQSGEYVLHFTNRFGCDSIVTLNLTINQQMTVWDTLRLMRSSLPYTFAAADTILSTGTPDSSHFIWHIPTDNGCDTVVMQTVLLYDDMTANVSGTINTDCLGRNCFYNGPTIMINEVMLSPSSYDGSIAGGGSSRGGEWIELYNPHKCDSADISCFFLGNNAYDGGDYGGGFLLPQNTIVPPQGFCIVRGTNALAVSSELLVENGGNVVEVVVDSRYCTEGSRLWFPNAGGWFAFYDANGIPQDAISWCSTTSSCMGCQPCNPELSECGYTGALPSYNDIESSRKNYISSVNPQNYSGLTFRRIPDGGEWQSSPANPTYGTCNTDCVEPAESTCNAIAVAVVSGGVPPYSYLWDDNYNQTTDTAFNLCAGTYSVTITDALLNTITAQVTIENFKPYVSHSNSIYCLSDASAVLSGFPEGGTYTGGTFLGNEFLFLDSAAIYPLTYTYADSNGCSSSIDFTVTVNPSYNILITDSICQHQPYDRYGFHLTEQQTTSFGIINIDSTYQTENQCDSIVSLELIVHPIDNLSYDTTICEGENFTDYGLSLPADSIPPGSYQFVTVYENQYGCDSTETVNLTVLSGSHHVTDTAVCYSYVWHGATYTTSGTYTYDYSNDNGCPSTDTLLLTVNHGTHNVLDTTVCESYVWHGITYAISGTYTYDYINADGCASTDTLHLTVNHGTHNALDTTVCESYEWHGTTYATSGTYTYDYINADGCASTDTLHLTVNHSIDSTLIITVVENDLPYTINDCSYTQSGTYYQTLTNTSGCDSTLTIQLTVLYNTTYSIDSIVCENQLPIVWNNITCSAEDVYVSHMTSTNGTDSTVYLNLTVIPAYETTIFHMMCKGDAYNFYGTNLTVSGTYTETQQNVNGCDSIINLQLDVIDTALHIVALTEDFCEENAAVVIALSEMSNYVWSTGDQTNQIIIYQPGTYTVTASQDGCTNTAHVTVRDCEIEMILSNAISPSKLDGTNDYFSIPERDQILISEFEISIFNRWGEMVFHSNDKSFKWYGDYRGEIYRNNVYNYVIRYKNHKGILYRLKGAITVL